MMEVRVSRICLVLLTVTLLLVCPASSSSDDEYCTEESCHEETELQVLGEKSVNWWSPYSVGEYVISLIKYNIEKQAKRLYKKATDVAEGVKSSLSMVVESARSSLSVLTKALYNKAVKVAEVFYNKTKIVAEQVYNHTAEFAGKVYEKIEEFAEKVRIVLREEFDSFLEVIWEDGSLGGTYENGMFSISLLRMYINHSFFSLVAETGFKMARRNLIYGGLTVLLVAVCALLDYIIWRLSTGIMNGITTIMAMNSIVFIVYKLKGPVWGLWLFWVVVEIIDYLGSFILTYPLPSAVTFCGLFLVSAGYNCWVKLWRKNVVVSGIYEVIIRLEALEEGQREIMRQIEKQDNTEE